MIQAPSIIKQQRSGQLFVKPEGDQVHIHMPAKDIEVGYQAAMDIARAIQKAAMAAQRNAALLKGAAG